MTTVLESRETRQTVPPSRFPGHLDFLYGLRGIGALYIVLGHAWLSTWTVVLESGNGSQIPQVWAWSGLIIYGRYAVTCFIALSGFCLMLPVLATGGLRGGAKPFFLRRARRILPPYYAVLLLSIVLDLLVLKPQDGSLFNYSLPVNDFAVATHVLLIHNLFAGVRVKINGPLWSIAAECQLYLLFPLLVSLWVRRGLVFMLAGAGTISAVLFLVGRRVGDHDLVPHYVMIFAMGMVAAMYAFPELTATVRPLGRVPTPPELKIAGLLALVMLFAMVHRFHFSYTRPNDLLVGLAVCCLLVVATRDPGSSLHRVIRWPPLVWAGSFSYTLYLIHFPLQQLFLQQVVDRLHVGKVPEFLLMAIAGTALIVPISYGFYLLVERPFARPRLRA